MLNATVEVGGNLTESPVLFNTTAPSRVPLLRDVSAGFSSIVQLARDVLINPDIAYRTDRYLQEQMLRDPMVMGPLSERKLMVAQLEYEIVPVAEEDEDAAPEDKPFFGGIDPKKLAKRVEGIFRRMDRQQDFFKQLLWADFRGVGASEINWEYDEQAGEWYPKDCIPHHGDAITFDIWGGPRILTRNQQTGGRELSREDCERLIIHVYQPDMGFFYKGEEAGYRFHGRGLRDVIWPYWWLSHNAVRFWVRFIQRFGMGFVLGKFPMGNAQAKEAIESVLQNLVEDSNVSVPVPADATEKDTYGIEFPSMGGIAEKAGVFKQFVDDWAGKHIRMMLVGQQQAHQESGDGLGSERANDLSDLRRMYRDDSAIALAATLTEKVVKPLQCWNFGELPIKLKLQFILEKPDYDQEEKRVKAAKDAGLSVARKWVHNALKIPMPRPGDDLVDFAPQAPAFPGAMGEDKVLFAEAIRDRLHGNGRSHWPKELARV